EGEEGAAIVVAGDGHGLRGPNPGRDSERPLLCRPERCPPVEDERRGLDRRQHAVEVGLDERSVERIGNRWARADSQPVGEPLTVLLARIQSWAAAAQELVGV